MIRELIRNLCFICLAFHFILSGSAFAVNHYVDSDDPLASDGNPGTMNQPWLTLAYSVENTMPGDTLFMRNGIYHEQLATVRDGNSTDGYIVFAALPGEEAVIDGIGVAGTNDGIVIGHSYIALIGLEVRYWNGNGVWAEHAPYLKIVDCDVHHVTYGIGLADGTHDFVLSGCDAHDYMLYGFDASPSGGAPCYNGAFIRCKAHDGADPQQNVDGIALGHGLQHDFTLNNCEVFNIYDGFDISASNTTLINCSAHDCRNGGFKLWQDNVKLINCLSYNNTITNVELDWDESPGTTTLQNCTFSGSGTYNVWIENSQDSLIMRNCILSGGNGIGLCFEQADINHYFGNNNLFQNDNILRAIVVGFENEFSVEQVSNGEWAAFSSDDVNSVTAGSEADIYEDAAALNFHLTASSPAVNAGGETNAPSTDYEGNPRPYELKYDIGAYEFQQPQGVDNGFNGDYFEIEASPNPFGDFCNITFRISKAANTNLSIYDLMGRKIKALFDDFLPPGDYEKQWNGENDFFQKVGKGNFFYILRIDDRIAAGRIVRL